MIFVHFRPLIAQIQWVKTSSNITLCINFTYCLEFYWITHINIPIFTITLGTIRFSNCNYYSSKMSICFAPQRAVKLVNSPLSRFSKLTAFQSYIRFIIRFTLWKYVVKRNDYGLKWVKKEENFNKEI